MKKQLLTTVLAVSVLGVASVSAAPQTDFWKGDMQASLGLWNASVEDGTGKVDGSKKLNPAVSLSYGLDDGVGIEYNYRNMGLDFKNIKKDDFKDLHGHEHQLNVVYNLQENLAAYAGWRNLGLDKGKTVNGLEFGLRGSYPVADQVDVYGQFGLGTEGFRSWEVGGVYHLNEDVDLNAGYRQSQADVKVGDIADKLKYEGFVVGASYKFNR